VSLPLRLQRLRAGPRTAGRQPLPCPFLTALPAPATLPPFLLLANRVIDGRPRSVLPPGSQRTKRALTAATLEQRHPRRLPQFCRMLSCTREARSPLPPLPDRLLLFRRRVGRRPCDSARLARPSAVARMLLPLMAKECPCRKNSLRYLLHSHALLCPHVPGGPPHPSLAVLSLLPALGAHRTPALFLSSLNCRGSHSNLSTPPTHTYQWRTTGRSPHVSCTPAAALAPHTHTQAGPHTPPPPARALLAL
jgi:hypothetical protein